MERCAVTTLNSFGQYCSFTGKLVIRKDNVYFLYKDGEHFYVLISGATDKESFLVNIGYVKKSSKEEAIDIINQRLEYPKEMNLVGHLIPMRSTKVPFIKNDLTNLELYYLNSKELSNVFQLPMSDYVIYSTSNDLIEDSPEVFVQLPRPIIKVIMHLWYAIMWYSISGFGLVYYVCISRRSKK
ncbi:SURF1 family protein [Neorickettsia helminthoeca str. Oregon]|uniref:SURF1-like protein n=1 Tax=Neorickettsia helminthoeca str. Oregon TaxID=1286528 RepID=X5H3C9_9RICK|nr:SURF1 family protein [Neorickettsia helminthoeca str. Oregon]